LSGKQRVGIDCRVDGVRGVGVCNDLHVSLQ
jgi:hypothetical protein